MDLHTDPVATLRDLEHWPNVGRVIGDVELSDGSADKFESINPMILYELCAADESHLFSPHCWKARMALAHKGLEFDTVATPFTGIAAIEDGSFKSVPVLRDGDTVLVDSFEIALYLEKKYPDRPSLFGGEGGITLCRFVASWSQSQLHPAIGALAMKDIHDILAPVDQKYFRTKRQSQFGITLEELHGMRDGRAGNVNKALLPLKLMLKGQKFIGGETPLFADYIVFGALQWMRMTCTLDALASEGEVQEWLERLLDMYGGMGRKAKTAVEIAT